jgi:uncharacterized membrane protein
VTLLVLGLILFFVPHSVSVANEPWRDAMFTRLGEGAWTGLYSLLSLAGLALIALGYAEARQDPVWLYLPPAWLRHVALLLLVPVFPLLLATYLPGRIKNATRHPTLVATKVWALAHLLANGTLADVALFGSFLVWAVADRISYRQRQPRPLPTAPAAALNDAVAVVGGLALYALFAFWLHQRLFGVAPIS